MYRLYKFIFGKIDNQNNNNTNNSKNNKYTNKNMEQTIIKIGHYKLKNSGTKDNPVQMIRILGEAENIPNHWKTSEKNLETNQLKTISEYELLNNWEYINTSISEESKLPPLSIFDDFDDLNDFSVDIQQNQEILNNQEVSNTPIQNIQNIQNIQQIQEKQSYNLPGNLSVNYHEVIELSEEQKFIQNILNKTIGNQNIYLNFDIDLGYNFDKLKETANLLDIDKTKLIDFILLDNNIKNIINDKIKETLYNLFIGKFKTDIITEENTNILNTLEDKEIFVQTLTNPPLANEKLKKAQINHSKIIENLVVEEVNEEPNNFENKLTSEKDPRIVELMEKLSRKWL